MKLRSTIIMIAMVTMPLFVVAQDDLENLLLAGAEDAGTLVNGYIAPAMNSFATGMTGGWYTSGKTHKSLGFEVLVTVNSVFIPDEDFFYSPMTNNVSYASGSSTQSPTVFGPDNTDVRYQYEVGLDNPVPGGDPLTYSGEFDAPPGIGLEENFPINATPVPMAQVGIGIIKNTDLKIRWAPTLNIDGGEVKFFGLGIMHDVKQHIPGINKLPFDLSALVGFTNLSAEYKMEGSSNLDDNASISTNNGIASYDMKAWTIQAIISKKFSVASVYGSIGYNMVNSAIEVGGDYEVAYTIDGIPVPVTQSFSNPVDLDYSQSGPRMTVGARLKFTVMTLNVDYTLQRNSVLTVGVGVGFREASAMN